MRRTSPYIDRQNRADATMTPMIDVVFLLLIFFVCTASFQIAEAMLPSPISSGAAELFLPEIEESYLEHVLVELIQREERTELLVNGRECPSLQQLSELLRAIAAIDSAIPVILDVDGATPLGFVIDVYDRSRLSGFTKIQFAVRQPF